ncbi:metallophosphoesterase [Dechloromonas denitrificans]|uniref:metallophosphoesterase family protein n=1 Tax=Dechloromonas denitrificans TaxID=281362 RepID=UPI001CF85E17|nr:metallophosphoesterase [Dechloromonas denitrificans]UCV11906.1 metallophosphoesterase [Dechloromonas denitrificans]
MKRRWRHALLAALLGAASLAVNAENRVFFVIGDTGDCELEGTAQVARALQQQADWTKASLIEVGDLGYPVATHEQLQACHEKHYAPFKTRFAVPGNHDWHAGEQSGFFSVFPGPVPRIESLGGPWRLLMLNSNLRDDAWEKQLGWLDKQLPAQAGLCLIAAWHHPRWSSGKHGDNRFTQPLWERLQGQASFTLHGHDHHFEALPAVDRDGKPSPFGVASFISGNAGAVLYGAGWSNARSNRAHYGNWGFMRLELDEQRYRWQAISVDGQIIDRGEGQCQPAGARVAPR